VGVDVFYVISGFLITSLLLKELNEGTFTLPMFWERRIRRIFPALAVVVAASFAAAWFIYTPEDFKWCAQSVMAQATLLANVYFWWKIGYFDPDASTKPLLHTWSLAVEEQFYVLFPLLLWWVVRRSRSSPARMILWLGAGSLALSVAGSHAFPDANYYLLPSRAWELMLGAWLAARPGGTGIPARWNETLAVAGAGLLGFSIFFYSTATRFPGAAALAPCLGAAFIIFSGGAGPTWMGRALAGRPVVFIGLISYSLYLWHWPLLVFAQYGRQEPMGWQSRLSLLLAAFVLAAVSWRWIEGPFRRRQICARRGQVFAFAGAVSLTLVTLGAAVWWQQGVPGRLPAQAQAIIKDFRKQNYQNNLTVQQAVKGEFAALGTTNSNRPISFMLWGDSHAMAVAPALDMLGRKYSVRGLEATHYSTPPLLGYETISGSSDNGSAKQQAAFARATVNYILQNHIRTVVIAAQWSEYGTPARIEAGLVETVQVLRKSGATVFMLKDAPGARFYVPAAAVTAIIRDGNLDRLTTRGQKFDGHNQEFEPLYLRLAGRGVVILDTPKYFLNAQGFYDVVRDGRILYVDDQHLTQEGAMLLVPMLEPVVRPGDPN
jgi:peptidoglycan/LPS O-acetylase OafA/YrhL